MATRSSTAGRKGGTPPAVTLERHEADWVGRFTAMGSPCEVLVDTDDADEAAGLLALAQTEAIRIEAKFSRYRDDGVVHRLNTSAGTPVELDEESASLIDYAATCHELSGGLFDITSGVLRRAWKFDGGSQVPTPDAVRVLLPRVGWGRVSWQRPWFTLPEGMEVDLGGIGKEYAVDRAAALLSARTSRAFLVNFGGDLVAAGVRRDGRCWGVGVDDPDRTGEAAVLRIDLERGALATSGDARRYLMWRGRRLGHILDPRTGWPVEGAPRAVTVLAGTCVEAGSLATLAYLQGPGAESFLREQGVRYWVV
jgi:thiamine biosynthesis lipoprotein